MDSVSFEWILGALFVGVNAYSRYNTPTSNRASTTFQNFVLYFILYFFSVLIAYVVVGALLDSSPEYIYGFLSGNPAGAIPDELANLSAPMVSALFLSTLMPTLPLLSRYDRAFLQFFWDRGHIPNHVQKKAAIMRRAPFNFSPQQNKQLRSLCETLQIDFTALDLSTSTSLDYRWARSNVLLESIEPWKEDDVGRLRRFMQENKANLSQLRAELDEVNREYTELKNEPMDEHTKAKMTRYLDRSITELFHHVTVFVAKAVCMSELTKSGRSFRVSQLGFEGGGQSIDGLSARQIAKAFLAILLTFLAVSVIQELGAAVGERKFGSVLFMTFLMMFTYGAALVIALLMNSEANMGYNELTRQRPWLSYPMVGIATCLSWLFVSISYRYIPLMLTGADSQVNLQAALNAVSWTYPYALQSLALASAISLILDIHQGEDISSHLPLRRRAMDVALAVGILSFASLVAFYWMEGRGWFAGYATKDAAFTGKTSMGWFIFKGAAVGAVVGWLVPVWFHLNRTRIPERIVGRLIAMNRRGLSEEIRNLAPNELLQLVATVAASVADVNEVLTRSEVDIYMVICSDLAGLPNSDVDTEMARAEFNRCLAQIENDGQLLETRLNAISHLSLLSSLMPFIAWAIAFADGVYLDREKALVGKIKGFEKRVPTD